ncbi:hypothetical protein T06_1282 [Trichinella sp. T6]|nr:hypothetical protein T06_1282 [Trichinella sp. T6]
MPRGSNQFSPSRFGQWSFATIRISARWIFPYCTFTEQLPFTFTSSPSKVASLRVIGSNRIFLSCDNFWKTYSGRILNSEPVSISFLHGKFSITTATPICRDNMHD